MIKNLKNTQAREELIESFGTKKRYLSNEDALVLQKPFLEALKRKMDELDLSATALAKQLNLPYSYIVALTAGARLVANSERHRVEKFADFLDVPVVQIYIWGGLLSPRDFVFKTGLESDLDNIFGIMSADRSLTAIVPSKEEWLNSEDFSEKSKLFAAQLYELYSGKMMLKRARLPEVDGANPPKYPLEE